MTRESELALLAAGSYWDIRGGRAFAVGIRDTDNRAPIPEGWKLLPEFISHSGTNATYSGNGFSARAYLNNNTGEIVISYAGTEFGATLLGMAADFLSGNIPLAVGHYNEQAFLAAKFYQNIKAQYGSNITFTGHSLGGGLASVMAVWFNRPAYVYASVPFQRSADIQEVKTRFKEGRSTCVAIDSTRRSRYVKSVRKASNRYALNSCLRYISLGYRLKTQVKSDVATMTRGGPL
jgi:Lipase (class 3)